ncbi:MAG: RHS repeat-associated core domain-containing protein [Flavobacterium sp.]
MKPMYLDGFQYKDDVIQFFPTSEGYANRLNNRYEAGDFFAVDREEPDLFSYVYNYTDHLGNIRLSYSIDPSTNVLKIIEENHYYPFGLKHNNYNSSKMLYVKEGTMEKQKPLPPYMAMSYNYKYNGKELQVELGLNMYDYGARNYDPALGRWMNVDPKAEVCRKYSPYVYAINNPIYFIDPDGMWISVFDNVSGNDLRYVNGKYYSKNKESGDYDVEMNVDKDSYAGKILEALNEISGGNSDSFGSKFLNLFSNDKTNVLILDNISEGEGKDRNRTDPKGNYIETSFDQNVNVETTKGSRKNEFYLTFFHEIAHSFAAQNYNQKTLDDAWISASEINGLQNDISNSEVYACTIENSLREEKALPLRTHYIENGGISQILKKSKEINQKGEKIYKMTKEAQGILNKILISTK